jgi:uncharacterized YigZ family protein
MEDDYYLTISGRSEGSYKDRGSKFLSFAFPVGSEEEVKMYLEQLRKTYHDARHHCYAWKIGSEFFRANDDGEPANSAGKPILAQIHARELTNVLVIVVRYFGGTLLGVGGLIQAYKSAASEALENAKILKKYFYRHYEIHYPYQDTNTVMSILRDFETIHEGHEFDTDCTMRIKLWKSQGAKFEDSFKAINSISLKLTKEE